MRRPAALLAAAAIAACALIPTVPANAAPANVTVALTGMTPMVPRPTDTLQLSGQVTNTGQVTVPDVQVRLRLVTTPLLGRSDITAVVDGNTGVQGDVVSTSVTDQPRPLDPGGQANWHLAVPTGQLPLSVGGVYVIVVEAIGTVAGTTSQLGLTRTFLPWVPAPDQVQPSHLVWLWPLTAPPTGGPDGVFVSDVVGRSFGSGGRLGRILSLGAAGAGVVSWLVDPQVLEAADAMSRGYRFETGGRVGEGTGANDATSWAAAANSVLTGAEVYPLPYALPDADALVHSGRDRDLTSTITQAGALLSSRLGGNTPPAVFWPIAGIADRRTLDVVSAAGVQVVVLPDTTLPTPPSQPYTSTGLAQLPTVGDPLQAVVTDSGLAAALAMPTDTPAALLAARQRFAAETAMVTFEDPGRPRTVVAAPTLDWNPDPALVTQLLTMVRTAPWISPVTLTTLLSGKPDPSSRNRVEYGSNDRLAELPATTLAELGADQRSLEALSGVLSDPTSVTQGYDKAILRAESSWWRALPDFGADLRSRIAGSLNAKVDLVRVVSRGTITLSGINGRIPLTIANDFDQTVTVGLVLHSSPAPRLKAAPVMSISIPPHRKISVEVPAQLAGSAPLAVLAQLVAANGDALGNPVQLSLRSTAYARAAKYVVEAAFGAMVLLLAANFTRRLRRRT